MYETTMDQVTDESIQNGLMELIQTAVDDNFGIGWENADVRTFEQAGVMTYDKGLVVTLPDGSEYQITIIQSY